jgi:hypothetical protein
MESLDEHPAVLGAAYRRAARRLLLMAAAGTLWSLIVFYFSVRPPAWVPVLAGLKTPFVPGVLYSWYACMHSFYIALSVFLCHMLISRGWLRAAAFAAMIPGPGFLFGLPQWIPAAQIYRAAGRSDWKKFFEWRHRVNPVNDLTKKRGGKLLPF